MDTAALTRTPGTPSPRRRRRVAALAALLFFFGPAVAFAAGDRADEIENREPAAFPALSRRFATGFEAWAVDHLPLRGQAVRAHTLLSERLFGEPPSYATAGPRAYPRVIEGRDGWLYFGDDVAEACRPAGTTAGVLDRVRRLGEIVRGSGRGFVFTVAPDKTTVSPDKLPDRFLGEGCLRSRKTELWAALEAARVPGYLDLRAPLLRLQRDTGEPAYFRTDSHWSERSAALYGAELARVLRPALAGGTRLTFLGRSPREGDLGRLLGAPRREDAARWRLDRDGVRRLAQDDRDAPIAFRVTNATTRAALFRPRTLIVGDSFTRESTPWITPYFADLTVLRSDAPVRAGPERVAGYLREAEVVVFEMVERYWAGGHGEMLTDETLAAVEKALKAAPRRAGGPG